MRRCTLIFIALIGLISCDNEGEQVADKHSLLTSTKWTDPAEDKTQGLTGTYDFNINGTYEEKYYNDKNGDKLVVTGTWKWISKTEVSMLNNSIAVNGEISVLDTDDGDRHIYRITEITKDKLVTIRRHSGDSENSGFASKVTFEAAEK